MKVKEYLEAEQALGLPLSLSLQFLAKGEEFDMNLVTKALHTDSVEVLKELSEHEEPSIRMAVASNHLHDPLWWVNDVDMMYFYWQDQRLRSEGQRLPEELHNSMIALAMNGDETANKYVEQSGCKFPTR